MARADNAAHGPTHPDQELLELVEASGLGAPRRLDRGEVLFWQGDAVEHVFIVRAGMVKEYSLLPEGQAYTFQLLGPGGLTGATACLLGKAHESIAQALDEAEVISLSPAEFDRLLSTNPSFSALVMKRLAQGVQAIAGKARDLGFLDVQQRLKHSLLELAREHGIPTQGGIQIEPELTHEEIGELVAANRSTITVLLNALKKRGLVWKQGRHWVVISPQHAQVLDGLRAAVVGGREWEANDWAAEAVAQGVNPSLALDALCSGMRQVEQMYVAEELDLTDLIGSAAVMKQAMAAIAAGMAAAQPPAQALASVVIGTVQGDIHDLGKNIVSMLLTARGFHVIDLGVDVPAERFVEAVRQQRPDILAMSALLTTTAQNLRTVIQALDAAGLRSQVKVMVGGEPITPHLAAEIGADGYAPTAREAAALAWQLLHD